MSDAVTDLTRGVYRRLYSGFITGQRINKLSLNAEAWFWRVLATVDDFGNADADPELVWLATRGKRKGITVQEVATWLREMKDVGLIETYKAKGEHYLHIMGFEEGQPAGRNGKRVRRVPECPTETPDNDYALRSTLDIKIQARKAVQSAIRHGKLKPQPCEECGAKSKIEAHHDDYTQPLAVKWLCKTCHGLRHQFLTKQGFKPPTTTLENPDLSRINVQPHSDTHSDTDTEPQAEEKQQRAKRTPEQRGTRLPDDFSLNSEMREWAAKETPHVDPDLAMAAFHDYWKAIPGARGRKLDWLGTWRNRMRDLESRAPTSNGRSSSKAANNLAAAQRVAAKYEQRG